MAAWLEDEGITVQCLWKEFMFIYKAKVSYEQKFLHKAKVKHKYTWKRLVFNSIKFTEE